MCASDSIKKTSFGSSFIMLYSPGIMQSGYPIVQVLYSPGTLPSGYFTVPVFRQDFCPQINVDVALEMMVD